MKVTVKSRISGKMNTMEIPVTLGMIALWKIGEPIQRVMPHLTPDQREFLMTGITPEEWEAEFGGEDGAT